MQKGANSQQMSIGLKQNKFEFFEFREDYAQKIREEELREFIIERFNSADVLMSFKQKSGYDLSAFFNEIRSAQWLYLNLRQNFHTNIISVITPPFYQSLMQLDLGNNQIQSLQGIAFLAMDRLQIFRIRQNQITDMKALDKTKWSSLKKLNLTKNPVKYMQFNRIKMASSFKQLIFEKLIFSTCLNQDLSTFSKLEPNTIGLLVFHKRGRIRSHKLISTLKKKYPNSKQQDIIF